MVRFLFTMTVVGLLGSAVGCRMCAHPYDYCGPRFTGQCGSCCNPMARAGSILAGGMAAPETEMEMPSGEMEGPAGELMPVPDDQMGSVQSTPQRVAKQRVSHRSPGQPVDGWW